MAKEKRDRKGKDEKGSNGSPKKGGRLFILIGLVAIVLGGSGGAYVVLGGKSSTTETPQPDDHGTPSKDHDTGHGQAKNDEQKAKDEHGSHDSGHGDAHTDGSKGEDEHEKKKDDKEADDGQKEEDRIVELKPNFVVNLKGTYGTRMLRVEVGVEIAESIAGNELSEAKKELEQTRKLPLRDLVINQLSELRVEDLDNEMGKKKLKKVIQGGINTILTKGRIVDVFFSEFVMQ